MSFSLELSEDQRERRNWVHGFAEKTIRILATGAPDRKHSVPRST